MGRPRRTSRRLPSPARRHSARAHSRRRPCPSPPSACRCPNTGRSRGTAPSMRRPCSSLPRSSPWCVAAGWCSGVRPPPPNNRQIEAPTSAPPAPSSVAPTAMSAPQPPPAPPPPPPPPPPSPPAAEPTYSAPQRQYSEPRYSAAPAQKPRVDGVTRAPMSVAPVPRPVAGSDSSTPGDAPGEKPRRRGCFGFC